MAGIPKMLAVPFERVSLGQRLSSGQLGALVVCLCVSGCAPEIYKDGVNTFGTAVTSVLTSETNGQTQLTTDEASAKATLAKNSKSALNLNPPACADLRPTGSPPKTPKCVIQAIPKDTMGADEKNIATTYSEEEARLENTVTSIKATGPVFDALKKYVVALTAVTNAADKTSLQAAEKSFDTSVGGVVGQFNKTEGTETTDALGVFADLSQDYLETRRADVLKRGVLAVDKAMPNVALAVGPTVQSVISAHMHWLQAKISIESAELSSPAAVAALTVDEYSAKYDALQTDIDTLNALTGVDAQATVDAMVKAHASLAAALQGDKGEYGAFAADVSAFSTDAQALDTAFAPKATTKTTAK